MFKNKLKITLAFFVAFTAEAYGSQWFQATPAMYMLRDTNESGYILTLSIRADTKTTRAAFIAANHHLCSMNPHGDKGEVGPYKVNGQFLKFTGVCMQSNLWIVPMTPQADEFLLQTVRKSEVMTLEADRGALITFNTSGVADIDAVLERAKKAL